MDPLLELNESSLYVSCHREEEEAQSRFEVSGKVVKTTSQNFKDVRILVVLRDARNRAIHTGDYWLDEDFEEGILEFSVGEPVPAKLLGKATVIEISAKGQLELRSARWKIDLTEVDSFEEPGGS